MMLFDLSGWQVWPSPAQSIDPAQYTPPTSVAYSDRWHETLAERQRQRELEREQVREHYDNQQREREAR